MKTKGAAKGKGLKQSTPNFLATGPSGVMGRGPSAPNPKMVGAGSKGAKKGK